MKAKAIALFVVLAMLMTGLVSVVPNVDASVPINVTASNVTSGSFTVTWSTTATETGYLHWQVGSVSPPLANNVTATGTRLHSAQVTGLLPSTTYTYSVWSEGVEYGPWQTTTTAGAPGSGLVYGHVTAYGGGNAVGVNVIITTGGNSFTGTTDASGNYVINVFGYLGAANIEVEGASQGVYNSAAIPGGITGNPHGPVNLALTAYAPGSLVMTPATPTVVADGSTTTPFTVSVTDIFGTGIDSLGGGDFTINWLQHDGIDSAFAYTSNDGSGDYTFTYTAGTAGPGTDQPQVVYSSVSDDSTITVNLPKWHMHIDQQGDADLDLVFNTAADHAGPTNASIAVPDGTVDGIIDTWETAALGADTDVAGTWTFSVQLWEDNDVVDGNIYAKIYKSSDLVTPLLTTGDQAIGDVANDNTSGGTTVSWTDTMPVATVVPSGDQIIIEYWFDATAGGSGSGAVSNVTATAATEVITTGTKISGTQADMDDDNDGVSNVIDETAGSGGSTTEYYVNNMWWSAGTTNPTNVNGPADSTYANMVPPNPPTPGIFTDNASWSGGSGTITKVEFAAKWNTVGLVDDVFQMEFRSPSPTVLYNDGTNYGADNTYYWDVTSAHGPWAWADFDSVDLGCRIFSQGAGWDGATVNVDAMWIRVTTSGGGGNELDVEWQYDLSGLSDPGLQLYIDAAWEAGDNDIEFQVSETGAWGGEETTVVTLAQGTSVDRAYPVALSYSNPVYVRAYVPTGLSTQQEISIDQLFFFVGENNTAGTETILNGSVTSGVKADMGPDDDGTPYSIQQADDVSQTSVITLMDESFEGTWQPTGWAENGASLWNQEGGPSRPPGGGSWVAGHNGGGGGSGLFTSTVDSSDATYVNFNFYFYLTSGNEDNDFDLWALDNTINWVLLDSIWSGDGWTENTWNLYTFNTTSSAYRHSSLRFGWNAAPEDTSEDVYVDLVNCFKGVDTQTSGTVLDANWTYDLSTHQRGDAQLVADLDWAGAGVDDLDLEWSNGDDGSWVWNNLATISSGGSVDTTYVIPEGSVNFDNDVHVRVSNTDVSNTVQQTVNIDRLYWIIDNRTGGAAGAYNLNLGYDSTGLGMDSWVEIPWQPSIAWTVDEVRIVNTADVGISNIDDQTVDVGFTDVGYAASYNATGGYLGDVAVTWSIVNGGGATATTSDGGGSVETFDADNNGGTATWTADYGGGITDSVVFTITPPTADTIDIRSAAAEGGVSIADQGITTGSTMDGWAAGYNSTAGYIGDVTVTWSVVNGGGASASTAPISSDSSTFNAGGAPGTATWTADYGGGVTDSVAFTITLVPYYLHADHLNVGSPDGNLDLNMTAIDQAGPQDVSLAVPDGTVDAVIGSWFTETYTESTDVTGTWTFNTTLWEDDDVIEGSIYAEVWIVAGAQLNDPATLQAIPELDNDNLSGGTEVEWTDTITGTVGVGQQLRVDFYFQSTAGGSGGGGGGTSTEYYADGNYWQTGVPTFANVEGTPDDVDAAAADVNDAVFPEGSTWGGGSGFITKVEVGCEWSSSGLTDDVIFLETIVLGTGTLTTTYEDSTNYGADNTYYHDITNDPLMSGGWTWGDIGNLKPGFRFQQRGAGWDGGTLDVDALWIRVTTSGTLPHNITGETETTGTTTWTGASTGLDEDGGATDTVTSGTVANQNDQANGETSNTGNIITNDYTATQASGGAVEDIQEVAGAGGSVNHVTDSIFNTNLAQWPIQVLTIAEGTVAWNAATATADGSGSFQAMTESGRNKELIGYQAQTLGTPIPASTAYTLELNWTKYHASGPPTDHTISIVANYSDNTQQTIYTDSSNSAVNGVWDPWTYYTNGFTVPAGKSLVEIRIDFSLDGENDGAQQVGLRVDDLKLITVASSDPDLDHEWNFNVQGEDTGTFSLTASATGTETFTFEWSSDGAAWNAFPSGGLTVSGSPGLQTKTMGAGLFPDTTFFVRALSGQDVSTDTLTVDYMNFETNNYETDITWDFGDLSATAAGSLTANIEMTANLASGLGYEFYYRNNTGAAWGAAIATYADGDTDATPNAINLGAAAGGIDATSAQIRLISTGTSGVSETITLDVVNITEPDLGVGAPYEIHLGYDSTGLGMDSWIVFPEVTVVVITPETSVDTISPYWDTTGSISVTATESSANADAVELYYRYANDNSSWGGWTLFQNDTTPVSWAWTFTMPSGAGYYEFYTIGWDDGGGGWEAAPGTADTLCAYDAAAPTSSVDTISPYIQASSPLTITATANDAAPGYVDSVELYYRYAVDNSSWGGWVSFGVDSTPAWSWSFNFPSGQGYYEFYTRATDIAGRVEAAPGTEDTSCRYLLGSAPITSVDTISPYWDTTGSISITATESSANADAVELYYRYANDNSSWGGWVLFQNDTTPVSWAWTFTMPSGAGYYEFYTIGWDDGGGGWESAPGAADTLCAYDNANPISSVNTIDPYVVGSSPLAMSAAASDSLSGIASVELWYRFSADNSTGWTSYASGGVDSTPATWTWNFAFPSGEGYYEFYTRATDNAGRTEVAPGTEDTSCHYTVVSSGSSDIHLDLQWNLFSLPLFNDTDAVNASEIVTWVAADGGLATVITWWEPGVGYFSYTGIPADDFELEVGYGYWIYLDGAGTAADITIYGLDKTAYDAWDAINGAGPRGDLVADGKRTTPLVADEYNLLGWFNTTTVTVEEYMNEIGDGFDGGVRGFVLYWDNGAQGYGDMAVQIDLTGNGIPDMTSQPWNVNPKTGYWSGIVTMSSITY